MNDRMQRLLTPLGPHQLILQVIYLCKQLVNQVRAALILCALSGQLRRLPLQVCCMVLLLACTL